jgi:hypothetical protein
MEIPEDKASGQSPNSRIPIEDLMNEPFLELSLGISERNSFLGNYHSSSAKISGLRLIISQIWLRYILRTWLPIGSSPDCPDVFIE